MLDREHFCCVRCEKVLLKEEAEVLFRTGFYRSIHALGCCKTCYEITAGSGMPENEDLFSEGRLKRHDAMSDQSNYNNNQLAIAL
ncbi:hypothetical protein Back11_31660 [Paenibacillus baekrokdamisoli]|uniref:Uncharacterized protein n=1 Tax=Paenibacillus baekrokdamisoli TaxID=1712516 RepID=A0A3G9J7P7_9BACL|nr:hypothetical protein [Paenibacillus baekrokdamisoli]MBB3071670.1 hypothetical protein [Paenibacillus baekrokdamisoli]BBH21821.1 hypothetical protein Back11_31660 [Paenibacillus baekrokdamisoli]